MNKKKIKDRIKVEKLKEWCIKKVKDEKRAYFYFLTGGSIKSKTSNCFCIKATRDLIPQTAAVDLKSPIKIACSTPTPECIYFIIQTAQKGSPGDISAIRGWLRRWVEGVVV